MAPYCIFKRLFCSRTYSSLLPFFGFSVFLLFPMFLLLLHYFSKFLPLSLPLCVLSFIPLFPGITGCLSPKKPSVIKSNLLASQVENPSAESPVLLDLPEGAWPGSQHCSPAGQGLTQVLAPSHLASQPFPIQHPTSLAHSSTGRLFYM